MKPFLILLFGLTSHLSTSYADPILEVAIHSSTNFSSDEYNKLMQAKALVEQVVNSEAFKDAILNFTYNGNQQFVQNNGMSNQQIYDYLMLAAEKYPTQTEANHLIDLDLQIYKNPWFKPGCKVLGYTDIATKVIHMNKCFYDPAAVNSIAMNLVHEWTHKMGFDHDFNATARRPSSVPYGVGYIVRDLGAKIMGEVATEKEFALP